MKDEIYTENCFNIFHSTPHLFGLTEIARFLGRRRGQIISWTAEGVFPAGSYFVLDTRVVYTKAAIEAGLERIRASIQSRSQRRYGA